MPNHYEPEMMIRGKIRRVNSLIETDFTIDLQDVGLAFSHHQNTTMRIDEIMEFWDGEFRLCISDRNIPPPVNLEQNVAK